MKTTRRQYLLAAALACATALFGAAASANAADKKPNILSILVDNLGYGELGSYRGGVTRGVPTPRIDSLAKEGHAAARGAADAYDDFAGRIDSASLEGYFLN
jgi:arylsulfatase